MNKQKDKEEKERMNKNQPTRANKTKLPEIKNPK